MENRRSLFHPIRLCLFCHHLLSIPLPELHDTCHKDKFWRSILLIDFRNMFHDCMLCLGDLQKKKQQYCIDETKPGSREKIELKSKKLHNM